MPFFNHTCFLLGFAFFCLSCSRGHSLGGQQQDTGVPSPKVVSDNNSPVPDASPAEVVSGDPTNPVLPTEPSSPSPSPSPGPSPEPTPTPNPTPTPEVTPEDPVEKTWPWPSAPVLSEVGVVPLWDSALLVLPAVAGAKDYRAFVLHDDLEVSSSVDGREQLRQATLYCAGFKQSNDKAAAERVLMRVLEVAGLQENDRIVVEAVDEPCPFVGAVASVHKDLAVSAAAKVDVPEGYRFSVYTEEEVLTAYQNKIVNGHMRAASLAQPAAVVHPHVLARTTVVFHRSTEPQPTTFFDGFTDATDQMVFMGPVAHSREQGGQLWQNSAWSAYVYNHDFADMHITRGQMRVVLADWAQEIFASVVMYPRRTVALSDNTYLKVVFDVASNATQRRYWWLSLCGAEQKNATMDNAGRLISPVIQTPFFYQPDGRNPSVAGWNCLQVFPRDGSPFPLGSEQKRTQSDVRVMVNRAGCGGLTDCAAYRSSVVNVSPAQYGTQAWSPAPGWYRQQNAEGVIGDTVLDDQLFVSPNTRYTFYISKSRVVMYVNGQQRLCNDFPSEALTMAEGALGFGQVLYHSSAERVEFSRSFNDRSGQYYYLENIPFVDVRAWDNMGYSEAVAMPETFDAGRCYTYQ